MHTPPPDAPLAGTPVPALAHGTAPEEAGPLPDLLGLSLAELRTLDHPVLREVLAELRARVVSPSDTAWHFDQTG